ncbi:TIGR01777 family oxidoreductase [Pedobacter sp. MC2016-14]|uniref:TIGR01777 family oxidoreductase n=1 Tax=Pedobacter sp. MC2016-14 TaxID=2897327 RepID=UPI001E36525D|nr:TIGR01777 family oxidoreductase [Pedobacter sp. MC2016-14]MCD0486725.1 TIGR01777 family oxidoreductase [Pedobacter sp. MC2016-14]
MKRHILITGATGMVGKSLIKALQQEGHKISILSRKPATIKNVTVYLWDIAKQTIDEKCFEGVDTVVHLAGENVAGKKWTKEHKQQIIDSRVQSAALLYNTLKRISHQVAQFISASAIGYYGDSGDEILTEQSDKGFGFLAECCGLWEHEADHFKTLGLKVVKVRIGFVLGKHEGALVSLEKPIRFFVGAPLGSGKQWIPWIHLDDLVRIFVFAIENPLMMGAYNACAPYPVTNATLTKTLAKQLNRPVWPINVPEKVLEFILGEMSSVVTMSTNTSAQKILAAGFSFKYTRLEDALSNLYQK